MTRQTRRAFLATTAGIAAGLAGCATGTRDSPEPVSRAESPPESDSPYASVYRETIESVMFVGDESGGGSGFVYNDVIVTNQHVVDGATRIGVRFENGEWRSAGVTATDIYADLAVLSTDIPSYATPLSLVESVPAVGTEVLALGSPFGLESSVSKGIISGRNRSLPNEQTGFSIPNTVQTDAGLDPGNSGGPIVTMDGAVTGIAVAGAGTSVGFAVSPLLARRVLTELIETGDYDHPFLGIRLRNVTPKIAEANDLDETRGIIVVETTEGGPAEDPLRGADSQTVIGGTPVPVGGDILVELAGKTVDSDADLGTILALELSPGDRIPATIIRNGEQRTVEVGIGIRPEP
jgi:S1-C subfamily serine protease